MGHKGNTNSLKNLERGRWLPGQSGNPSGRAKGVVYTKTRKSDADKLRAALDDGPALKLVG